jgi:hypothetical protein
LKRKDPDGEGLNDDDQDAADGEVSMRSLRRVTCAAAVLLLALMTAACAPNRSTMTQSSGLSSITLSEARAYQNDVLFDLISFVPTDVVTGGMSGPIDRMHAMTCDWSERPAEKLTGSAEEIFLPGGYDVEVASDISVDALFDEVQAAYAERPGWEVSSTGESRERVVALVSPEGYTFYLESYTPTATTLRVSASSFSPCFSAPTGFDRFETY